MPSRRFVCWAVGVVLSHVLAWAGAVLVLCLSAAPPGLIRGDLADYDRAATLIVGFKDGHGEAARNAAEAAGLTVVHDSRISGYLLCKWKDRATLVEALRELDGRGDAIDYVEPVQSVPLKPGK